MRLSKYLQKSGVASRSESEKLIAEKRVKINGKLATEPFLPVEENDKVTLDDRPIEMEKEKHYYILNKPQEGKVEEYIAHLPSRLFPIGIYEGEGLILITNDGDFANRVYQSKMEKEYLVEVDQPIRQEQLEIILKGNPYPPLKVEQMGEQQLKITIEEGKRREIRYLLYNTGLNALSIIRIRIGSFTIDQFPSGKPMHIDPLKF